jgi:L-alanine-DL-glutamate epimerase-like enolase superfamily enzyme
MPGDRRTPWDLPTAIACARALERSDVYWLEEPLPTADLDGYRTLRQRSSIRIAAGEMVRSLPEARDLVLRGGIDVVQPDVVLAGGIGGCRQIAAFAALNGRAFSPHTWTNGMGLAANLHLACAVSTCPFIEVPFDPPAWSGERRDWMLPTPIPIDRDGTIMPPDGPGLGVRPDLDAIERYRVA